MQNCHNKRITQKLSEESAIEEMDTESKPIVYLMAIVLSVVLLNAAYEAYSSYQGYKQTSAAFAKCVGGEKIDTGEGVITCGVGRQLVKGIEK